MLKDGFIAQIVFETIAMHIGHPNTTQNEILSLLHIFKQFSTIASFIRYSLTFIL